MVIDTKPPFYLPVLFEWKAYMVYPVGGVGLLFCTTFNVYSAQLKFTSVHADELVHNT